MPISRLRQLQRGWFARLLFVVVAAGLLLGTGLRATPHSHHDDGLGQAHHALLPVGHELPTDVTDEEPSPVSSHFHYSASLVFVDASAPSLMQAEIQAVGVLPIQDSLTPPSRDAEIQHRPPIA
jgi:hypothetical protein